MKFNPRLVALGCAVVFMSEALADDSVSTRLRVTRAQPENYICLVSGLGLAPTMEKQFAVAAGKNHESRNDFRPPYDDAFDPRLTCSSLAASSKFEFIKRVGDHRSPGKLQSTSGILTVTPPN